MEQDIQKQFSENIDAYMSDELIRKEKRNEFLINFLTDYYSKNYKNQTVRILEVGGGSGQLLKQILDKFRVNLEVVNLEITPDYRKFLADQRIKFINKSLFSNDFEDSQFDCVICRYGLHHFVEKDLKSSFAKQEKGVSEFFRLVKDKGIIVIEEEFSKNEFIAKAIFCLSSFLAKFKFSCGKILRAGVTVLFLTEKRLLNLIKKHNAVHEIIEKRFRKLPHPLFLKFILLFQEPYAGTYIFRIKK